MKATQESFEQIATDYEPMIHHHIYKLGIRDPESEFFQEGCIALWKAYTRYDPEKGSFRQLANYMIRNRLIDLIRKHSTAMKREHDYLENHRNPELMINIEEMDDFLFWNQIRRLLTENQWKWVEHYIILDQPLTRLAEKEGTTIDAVKGWGKQARKKLRMELDQPVH
ncbi:sigma-70 family RNA polymerase sigma factor [Thalassobacillus hwangdonensis]|uniref:Sigma-70 family RNA polymerase sigma factor n=1 Tax=Thalassobacillus hwangdonensis TaxID=546108 RepID=A0ABW3L468_9BACI